MGGASPADQLKVKGHISPKLSLTKTSKIQKLTIYGHQLFHGQRLSTDGVCSVVLDPLSDESSLEDAAGDRGKDRLFGNLMTDCGRDHEEGGRGVGKTETSG